MKKNFIIGILCLTITSAIITGCGENKNARLDTTSATEATTDAVSAHDNVSEEHDVKAPNTMFVEEKNRVTEHHGDMHVEAKNVSDYCKKLNTTIAQYKGHSSALNIEDKEQLVKQLPHSSDSICQVIRTHQEAKFEFRIPKKEAPQLVNALLQLDGKILSLNLLEEDKTLEYREAQIIDEAAIASKAVADSLGVERTASNRASKEEIKFRSQFLWCSVAVQSPEVVIQKIIANPNASTAHFGTELADSLRSGNSFMRQLILVCFEIWPLLLAGVGIWYLVRKKVLVSKAPKQ
jgi:hypothetical protein